MRIMWIGVLGVVIGLGLSGCDGAELSLGDDDDVSWGDDDDAVGDDDTVGDDDDTVGDDDDTVGDDDDTVGDDDDTVGDDDDTVAPCGTLVVSPTAVTFPTTQVGQTASATLTLDNSGADPVEITTIAATGAEFSYQGIAPPLSIAAGGSETFTVSFAPLASGVVTGGLSITSCDGTATVSLEGEGQDCTLCEPDITVSPTHIDFGSQLGGTPTATFTVTNDGDLPLTLSAVTGTSSTAGGLVTITAGNATATLNPDDVETFTAEWTPGELFPGHGCLDALDGLFHAITIDSDDPDEATVSITLQGCCDAVTGGSLCNYGDPSGLLDCMNTAPCASPLDALMYCTLGLPC